MYDAKKPYNEGAYSERTEHSSIKTHINVTKIDKKDMLYINACAYDNDKYVEDDASDLLKIGIAQNYKLKKVKNLGNKSTIRMVFDSMHRK